MRPILHFAALGCALLASPAIAVPLASDIKASFHQLDADGNGECSLSEWESVSVALFRSLDQNRDHKLELAEVQSDLLAGGIIAGIDQDKDGRLSLAEFMPLRYAIFHAADIDGTDHLNFVEYELLRLLAESGWVDANQSNRIEIPELRPSLHQVFTDADLDHNGRLTASEATFLPPEDFSILAKNSGAFDVDELIAHYKRKLTAP